MTDPAAWSFETRQIHAGTSPDPTTGARALPIYATTAYQFRDSQARRRPVRAGRDGQHLHADHEPDAGRARAARGLAGGRRRGAGGVERAVGDDAGAAEHRRGRRPHRRLGLALRRHVQPAAPLAAQARRHGLLRRGPGRPGGVAGAGAGQHQGVLRRDDRQPQGRPPRHRGGGRGRAPQRRPADRGQHHRDAVPDPAVRVRRGRRRPLGHEVPGRARHGDRRADRRRRRVRLDAAASSPASPRPTRRTTASSTPRWARRPSR